MLCFLLFFILLHLCKYRVRLVDSPCCEFFKRSSIRPSPRQQQQINSRCHIRLLSNGAEKILRTPSPLWVVFTSLCVFEKGLPGLSFRRGSVKNGESCSETNKNGNGTWEHRVKVSARPLLAATAASSRQSQNATLLPGTPLLSLSPFTGGVKQGLFEQPLWPCLT